ncbi:MAG: 4-(cytidine 5'-diphospho)-2-C-methyl-D-erythritol kinase [Bacteroidia bacterium]|nr:4-(cytidine 5'-diphospho)-2-C-methyl-D-erythritol kinase [Bacteroidia bacterium]
MLTFSNCKINLGLHILDKRSDGYHNLETVFYPVSLCDVLEVITGCDEIGTKVKLIVEGLPVTGTAENNLITKAYHLLDATYQLEPVTFCLLKKIPMGSGLGGGSSNAAFALKLLDQLFNLKLRSDQLKKHAGELGSDCAFFIDNTPAFATGKGEILKDIALNLSPYHIVLVTPPVHVSTAVAFSKVIARGRTNNRYTLIDEINMPVEEWKNVLINDFENSVFMAMPALKTIKEKLYNKGAIYASMSGSGSTIYGIFKSRPDLKASFAECGYFETN